MKILIGSHGTGKTTLLREVASKFPDYYVTDGFSRPVSKISKMLELANNEKQFVINELSAWAYQNYLTHRNVISTRSLVDCIIYSQIVAPDVDIQGISALFEETKNQVEYFFYIPIEFDYVIDEGRPGGEWQMLQMKIDKVIQDFIKEHIPAEKIVTLTGTVEERLQQISKYL
jgi:predicted ATPase